MSTTALDELTQINERELLQNVDINFLFAKGYKLVDNLIDMNRVYLIVDKIKQLARQQAIEGSKDINYDALVLYLREIDEDQHKDEIEAATNDPQEAQDKRW